MTEQGKAGLPEGLPTRVTSDGGDADGWSRTQLPTLLLGLVALLVALDVASDVHDGADLAHVALEFVVFLVSAGGALVLWWQLRAAHRQTRALRADLSAARADLERFRAESQDLMRGLGAVIDRQFDRWALSPAEREVALLLLKGLSHKDAAEVRSTSERTVRQQALAVYRKAGLAGRAELSAFFLEDLLLPGEPGLAPGR
jgi:DNA-binding NarL/FixJ family response regulator